MIDIPAGSLEIESIPLLFFFLPTLGGGGIGFFLAWSLRLLRFASFLFT